MYVFRYIGRSLVITITSRTRGLHTVGTNVAQGYHTELLLKDK